MNTFQLECFIKVAETLNYARAAESLGITQPAVTHQINTLENELGTKLFNRTTRKVSLTHNGRIFFLDAKQILELSHRALHRFSYPDQDAIEFISLGAQGAAQLFAFSEPLSRLKTSHPYIHPRLQIYSPPTLNHMLEEGNLDLILGFFDKSNIQKKFRYKELAKVPVSAFCLAELPLAKNKSLTLEELKNHNLILPSRGGSPSELGQISIDLMNERNPINTYFVDSTEAAVVLVEAGFGLALVPDHFLIQDEKLATIPITDVDPLSFGYCVKSIKQSEALEQLMKYVEEFFEKENRLFKVRKRH